MATTEDEDKDYRKALVDIVQGLSEQLGTVREQVALVREQVSKDLADYLSRYREDVSRSILSLSTRVFRIEEGMDKDATARAERQKVIDDQLSQIHARLTRQDVRGNLRFGLEILLVVGILVVIGLLLGR